MERDIFNKPKSDGTIFREPLLDFWHTSGLSPADTPDSSAEAHLHRLLSPLQRDGGDGQVGLGIRQYSRGGRDGEERGGCHVWTEFLATAPAEAEHVHTSGQGEAGVGGDVEVMGGVRGEGGEAHIAAFMNDVRIRLQGFLLLSNEQK